MQPVSFPPAHCAILDASKDAQIAKERKGRANSTWKFVISCTQADGGVSSWYATEPVFMNDVCSYRYEPIAPTGPLPGESLVPRGTVFDRAAVASAAPCPGVISGAYTNLWKVGLGTFKAISGLDYRAQFRARNINSKVVHIEIIYFVKRVLWCDQYKVDVSASNGALYAVSVYLSPFGNYWISSFDRLVLVRKAEPQAADQIAAAE
jgi:hypothetical protein